MPALSAVYSTLIASELCLPRGVSLVDRYRPAQISCYTYEKYL